MNNMIKVLTLCASVIYVFNVNAAQAPAKRQKLSIQEGVINQPPQLSLADYRKIIGSGERASEIDCSDIANAAPSKQILESVANAGKENVSLKRDREGFCIPEKPVKLAKPAPHASQAEWKRYLESLPKNWRRSYSVCKPQPPHKPSCVIAVKAEIVDAAFGLFAMESSVS